jgi:hypothetical protein
MGAIAGMGTQTSGCNKSLEMPVELPHPNTIELEVFENSTLRMIE